jgi:hypothetical protein
LAAPFRLSLIIYFDRLKRERPQAGAFKVRGGSEADEHIVVRHDGRAVLVEGAVPADVMTMVATYLIGRGEIDWGSTA